jgi:hypothetical protein
MIISRRRGDRIASFLLRRVNDANDVVDGAAPGDEPPYGDRCDESHEEPSTMQIATIGLDLAKHVFQVHGIDAAEKVVVGAAPCARRA